ncbi:MAG: glycosyl hydrolase family 2 [Paludibacteraceae bacterium]|nr:glycosyl hydrolase family 2 [Paludibacteraceae bacterium]
MRKSIIVLVFCTFAINPVVHSSVTAPGTRWWWLGSAVDSVGITYQLESLSKAGIGAVEITPIYGVQGNEANDIPFLSPRWMDMLGWCETEGERLGVQIDMNNGTGWPFGGPEVTVEDAACKAVFKQWKAGETMPALTDREKKDFPVLTGKWGYASGDSVALYLARTRQKVKRAAPGGEGYVIDHFNRSAVERYLSKFDTAFARSGVAYPHTFFNDSYEVYGADWTPALLEEFARRRGYRLEEHFPAFLNEQAPGHADILCDYRETLGELLMENFAEVWVNWCHSHGAKVRNQSHGSPANLLDMYGAVDIPEIEGFGLSDFGIQGLRTDSLTRPNYSDLSMLKYPASVAHFYGKPLVTAETFTWLTEHWRTSLSQCKPDFDLMMVAGVNRCYFHGTAYSPETAPWPGYLFYAAMEMNPQNTIWRDVPAFTAYMQRVQAALQEGKPDNDLLVYLPVYDIWSEYEGRLLLFDIHKMDKVAPRFIHAVNAIYNAGYDLDYVSDRMLDSIRGVDAEGRLIAPSGITYKALVLPEVNRLPLRTMQRVSALAAQGATVIYVGGYPQQLPGWSRQHTQSMRDEFADAEADLPTRLNKEYRAFKHGKGRVVVAKDYSQFAKLCPDLRPETMKKQLGLKTIRRCNDEGAYYFLANLQKRDVAAWIRPAVPFCSASLYDPMTGTRRPAVVCGDSLYLALRSGESVLLQLSGKKAKSPKQKATVATVSIPLTDNEWTLTPIDIHSFDTSLVHRTSVLRTSCLTYWSDLYPDAVGTMAYETTVELPRQPREAVLRLGDVRESAHVYVNGQDAGTVFAAPFEVDITPYLHKGTNTLRIEVTSLAANYLAEMDRRGIVWRRFKDANIANLKGGKVSYYGNWDVMPSGLNSAELIFFDK